MDSTADGIRQARGQINNLQKPGPKAPFQNTPLTNLESRPFDNKPGPSKGIDKQVGINMIHCIADPKLTRQAQARLPMPARVELAVLQLHSAYLNFLKTKSLQLVVTVGILPGLMLFSNTGFLGVTDWYAKRNPQRVVLMQALEPRLSSTLPGLSAWPCGEALKSLIQAEYYKKRLFYCVSGLDRGSAANSSAAVEVEAAVASLLSVSSPVLLSWAPGNSLTQLSSP